MKLYFHGGAGVVTGVNYLLETDKTKVMIDCGLFQGRKEIEEKTHQPFAYSPKEIDFVCITHAHLDHIGRLPRLIEEGFDGQILATAPTIDFARLMLEDSQKILHEKAIRAGVIPPVDGKYIDKVMKMFRIAEYDQKIELSKEVLVCFKDAGHILGSAIIEIEAEKKKIVFSGDLGSSRVPILKKPSLINGADYVIIESAYGDRNHEPEQISKEILEDTVEETIAQKGVLMIPSFALERTQQLLYHFNDLVENHRIPEIPIFLDSPLAIKLTRVYARYPQYYDQEAKLLIKSGDDIFKFPGLKLTEKVEESKAINDVLPPKIIIAGSGMSQGGRILHHEVRYLSDPKSTLLVVTYQVEGTLGREILEGAKKVKILDQMTLIRAQVKTINGYSGHADQRGLVEWLSHMVGLGSVKRPKRIFVCQGEEKPANALAQKIRDNLGLVTEIPQMGQIIW